MFSKFISKPSCCDGFCFNLISKLYIFSYFPWILAPFSICWSSISTFVCIVIGIFKLFSFMEGVLMEISYGHVSSVECWPIELLKQNSWLGNLSSCFSFNVVKGFTLQHTHIIYVTWRYRSYDISRIDSSIKFLSNYITSTRNRVGVSFTKIPHK